jgi:hypothetical protein
VGGDAGAGGGGHGAPSVAQAARPRRRFSRPGGVRLC